MLPISFSTNFCEQKYVQRGLITIAIGCIGLFLLIVEEKWPNYASGPKFAPNSDSFWVRRFFNVCVWSTETKCCQYPPLHFLWTKIRSKWSDNDRHWLWRPLLAHFRRKMAQLCLWAKIRTKQWLVLGASAFQCMRAGFLWPKCAQFCLFTYPPRSKWASSEKMIFFCQNRHLL